MLKVGSLILALRIYNEYDLNNTKKGSQIYHIKIAQVKLSVCFKKKSLHYLPTFRPQSLVLPHSSDPPRNRTAPPPAAPPAGVPAARCPGLHSRHRTHRPPPPPPPQLWRAPSVTVGLLLSSQTCTLWFISALFGGKKPMCPSQIKLNLLWKIARFRRICAGMFTPCYLLPRGCRRTCLLFLPFSSSALLTWQTGGQMTSSTIASHVGGRRIIRSDLFDASIKSRGFERCVIFNWFCVISPGHVPRTASV